jgi:hypothetical protein
VIFSRGNVAVRVAVEGLGFLSVVVVSVRLLVLLACVVVRVEGVSVAKGLRGWKSARPVVAVVRVVLLVMRRLRLLLVDNVPCRVPNRRAPPAKIKVSARLSSKCSQVRRWSSAALASARGSVARRF